MKKAKGVALVLVVFIVALASMLVINLTYSTFLAARTTGLVERSLQSEYLLKSLLNFSQILIQNDTDVNVDSYGPDELWGIFASNPQIPNHYFGITDQSSEISMQIVPTNSKFNISLLGNITSNPNRSDPDARAQQIESMMNELGFDDDLLEADNKKIAGGKSYSVREVIGNLIDWQDRDDKSFDDPFYTGMEKQVNKDSIRNKKFNLIGQLSEVPGITPRRLQALIPYISTIGAAQSVRSGLNVNTATPEVLIYAHPEIDEGTVSSIQQYLDSSGPFKTTQDITNSGVLPTDLVASSIFTTSSSSFDIYAEVKSGLQRPYYLKARLARGRGQLATPKVLYSIFY